MRTQVTLPFPLLTRLHKEPQTFSQKERLELLQAALDALDYVEKKLIQLENVSERDGKILRRLHGAFEKLYRVAWSLDLHPEREFLKNIEAYLGYIRRDLIEASNQEICQLFSAVDILERFFELRRAFQDELPKNRGDDLWLSLEKMNAWLVSRLQQVESEQRAQMEEVPEKLAQISVQDNLLNSPLFRNSFAEKIDDQSLSQEGFHSKQVITPPSPKEKATSFSQMPPIPKARSKQLRKAFSLSGSELLGLQNLTGELTATVHRLVRYLEEQSTDPFLNQLTEHLEFLTSSLRNNIRSFSSVPIQELYDKIQMMLGEFSRRFDRKVELSFHSEIQEIDRNDSEVLSGLLIHLLRNAVEHGIESPTERLLKGKPEIGKVIITAERAEDGLYVTFEDDGVGLNIERLRQEALRQGLITPEQILDNQLITRLLFQDGIAVRDPQKVGYGFDKIGRRLRDVKGEIRYQTRSKGGTRFTIRLPLSPSYLHGLVVSNNSELYLFPSSLVSDIFSHSKAKITYSSSNNPMLQLDDDSLVPIRKLELRTFFENPRFVQYPPIVTTDLGMPPDKPNRGYYIVVNASQNSDGVPKRCALYVEELHDTSMVELLFVGPRTLQNPLIWGGGFIKKDTLVWIIDPTYVCQETPLV